MNVVVIGGGASGLVSAIYAARNNNKVTILEKNNVCGKKILVTGNGRCNYFNSDFNISHYRSNNLNILEEIINEENKNKILNFFDSIGIVPKIKNECYYPYSNKAVSIQNGLLLEVQKLNIEIKDNILIDDIEYKNNFKIKTNEGVIEADKVVLATGSIASSKDKINFGYEIIKKFGHSIIKPLPALVKLIGNETYFKEWSGIRSDVYLSLYEDNKKIAESKGEAMFTDYGISGICTLDLSGRVARGLYNNKLEQLKIDFLPYLEEDFITYINERNKKLKNRNLTELFEGMLNYKLVNILLKTIKIDNNKNWNQLNEEEKNKIKNIFKSFNLNITDTKSYQEAQICSGGCPLTEINIKTMESLKQKNLYIVGELLDVDGDCGGYNLGFAWLSGMLAGSDYRD